MLQLTIEKCLRTEVESLSGMLEERGALSITYRDEMDTPIFEPEPGTTPLWEDVVIEALYESNQEAEIRSFLAEQYPHLQVTYETLEPKEWERECIADIQPMQFGERLWICPSWLTPPNPQAINVQLDPGLAFGTGMHPTTQLCLSWLEQADVSQKRLIDYGCGSGILALAALKLGAQHVEAVDLDEQALIATRQNAALNQLSLEELSVSRPEALSAPADILVANILLTPLLELKNRFLELLHHQGTLLVSGLLKEQEKQLIAAYQDGFSHQLTKVKQDWVALVFSKS